MCFPVHQVLSACNSDHAEVLLMSHITLHSKSVYEEEAGLVLGHSHGQRQNRCRGLTFLRSAARARAIGSHGQSFRASRQWSSCCTDQGAAPRSCSAQRSCSCARQAGRGQLLMPPAMQNRAAGRAQTLTGCRLQMAPWTPCCGCTQGPGMRPRRCWRRPACSMAPPLPPGALLLASWLLSRPVLCCNVRGRSFQAGCCRGQWSAGDHGCSL